MHSAFRACPKSGKVSADDFELQGTASTPSIAPFLAVLLLARHIDSVRQITNDVAAANCAMNEVNRRLHNENSSVH